MTLSPVTQIWIWGIVVILCSLLLGIVVVVLRRNLIARRDAVEQALSVAKLEELRRSGLISDEEFRVLRRRAMGLPAEAAGKGESLLRPPGKDDDADSGGQRDSGPA